jgi:hypothetical protein
MTARCYVALGGASASRFRAINLQTISEKKLTALIFKEAKHDDVFEPHKEGKANAELERTDTLFSNNDANVNVKFTLHCSKEKYIKKRKNFLAGNQESLPIDSKIAVNRQYGSKCEGTIRIKGFTQIEQIINNELDALAQTANNVVLSKNMNGHQKYNPRIFAAFEEIAQDNEVTNEEQNGLQTVTNKSIM